MPTPESLRADVRRLRREQTEAESLLWQQLRARRLAGAKFRRQHPISDHIVDFCCIQRRLIVEVDDAQPVARVARNGARTAGLEALGYKVIRFGNDDVLRNLDGVLSSIMEALRHSGFGDEAPDTDTESES